jgi:hypothetical protein
VARGSVGVSTGLLLLAVLGGGCGGTVNCGPCQDLAQVYQPLRASLGTSLVDGAAYRFCAGDVGCWTATVLLPDPAPAAVATQPGEPLCLVDALPSEATCRLAGERRSWEPGQPARLVVEVRSRPEPFRDVTVTVEGLGEDRRTGSAETEYVEGQGECSCGDRVSAKVDLR